MNTLQRYRHYLMAIFLMLSLSSCGDDDDDDDRIGNWTEQSSYEGVGRSSTVHFVIGNKAYVGLGYDGDDYLSDIWSYDVTLNFWERVADFPGVGRTRAVAFSIGNKGYVGTGYDGSDNLKDFWEYDSDTNSWTRKADFGGSARYGSVGFALSDEGYIGTGYDGNYLKDFWKYSPDTDTWEQIVSVPGDKREDAVAFTVGSKAYLGTGRNNGIYVDDFWEYDAITSQWSRKLDLDEEHDEALFRHSASAFTLNGLGYLLLGSDGGARGDVWEYNPTTDTWTEKTHLSEENAVARLGATGFAIGERAFAGLGRNGTFYLEDIWEFKPFEEFDEDE